jgi:hypothetical protein
METKEITFTQYLRPDGQQVDIYFPAPDHLYLLAEELIADGYRFEAEVLTTGEISLTVSDGEEDIAIQLCPNSPGIEKFVGKLIEEATHKASGIPTIEPIEESR